MKASEMECRCSMIIKEGLFSIKHFPGNSWVENKIPEINFEIKLWQIAEDSVVKAQMQPIVKRIRGYNQESHHDNEDFVSNVKN